MYGSEPKSESDILRRAVATVGKRFPAGWEVSAEYKDSEMSGIKSGALLTVTAPDGVTKRLLLEAKKVVARRDVGLLATKLNEIAVNGDTPVLVARYLTPQVRSDLVANGVGYIDLTGNLLITSARPAIFLSAQGEDNDPWRGVGRPRGTLRGEPAARVVRALLDFNRVWGVRDLINTSGASTGATYRVLEYLQQEGLAERDTEGAIRVPDWRRLLEAWAEDAPFMSMNRSAKYIDPRGIEAFLGKLRDSEDRLYAVTGSVAASEWAPYASSRIAYVYVDSIEESSEQWGLHPSESTPNIILLEPKKSNDVVFDRLLGSERGFLVASPSQVAVDLWNGPGRNPSEAQELLAWMSANESRWRDD